MISKRIYRPFICFYLTCSSLSFSAKRKENINKMNSYERVMAAIRGEELDTKKEPKHLKQLLEISLAGLVYRGIAVAEA
jgi:hypothetical protein